MMKMLPLLLLLLLSLLSSSLGADVTLSSVEDFTDFVNSVNSGSDYSGTTVYLDSDLSLSEKTLDPIGSDTSNYFLGTFDGQGHTISDLKMNSSSQYIGLFGHSEGLSIRNVVLDSSCSITNSFESSSYAGSAYIGGIVGYFYATSDGCIIENSVNMADVAFNGNTSSNLYIGGIAGNLISHSSSYSIYVKNCVNYGSVTHSGIVNSSSAWAELGGIVGISGGNSIRKYVQNCLNYGTITHNGTSSKLIIGGIVGNSASYTYIENCVSAGKISTQTTALSINYVGGIAGEISTYAYINYCYYTSDVNVNSLYGDGTPESITGSTNSTTDVDSDLVSKLNTSATSCNWDKWFMLHLNGGSINNLKQELLAEIQGHIPNPVKEGNSFLFWCKDAECTEEFNPKTSSVSGITDLYAAWVNNIVTFYANGGSVPETSKIVTFNEKYGNLPEPKKEGYMLIGWFIDAINGTEVTNETIVTIPANHTLYAHWEEVTNQVEIVFNTKDLTQEDVEKLIGQYTEAEFEVIRFEEEPGEIRVIVKFDNKEDAEKFVRSIEESNRTTNLIKKIGFDKGDYDSFSTMIYPFLFLNTLFL